eukprot:TRINITY_DN22412_c0_g1_i1.p1 TRINITY_DN22412_c0_g1~~TRINITY_DN22412_c0_g1_i1.p1  ORF type:complete len:461 (+),score=88.70 TRINITY_DN22412_c0_g1_i1:105-1385(+)
MADRPPIWMLVLVQLASVIGDSFGQRVSRVEHKGSRRHMMISLAFVSSIQMILVLGVCQLALSPNITGASFGDGKPLPCQELVCSSNATVINATTHCYEKTVECEWQGPLTMFQTVFKHPFLLINGAMNLVYYTGETMLYREPLGLVFLVMAALTSTFLIAPINLILGQPLDQPLPPVVLALGIVGAVLCVIERKAPADPVPSTTVSNGETYTAVAVNTDGTVIRYDEAPPVAPSKVAVVLNILKASVRIIIPFLLLSVTYALWFIIQKYSDDHYSVTAFGYNALDQGLLPFYVFPYLFLIDFIKPFRRAYEEPENYHENFFQAIKNTWHEMSIIDVFLYRLFINGRAFAYFFLAVSYDLTVVYLELTLIRVLLSWLASCVLILLIPKFVGASIEERKTTFHWINLILKALGSGAVTASLILLNTE